MKKASALVALAALLSLSAIELHSQGSQECIELSDALSPGMTTQVSIEQPTWLSLETSSHHIYRVEVSGPDGSAMEVWTTGFESSLDCTVASCGSDTQEISNGKATFEWISPVSQQALLLIPSDSASSEELTVTYEELAAPPESLVAVVPAVAHAPGAKSTFFQTDVKIFNPHQDPVEAQLVLVRSLGGPSAEQDAADVTVTIEPQHILALDDIVLTRFGLDNATGALRIHGPESLVVISRTYSSNESGSYGQFIPGYQQSFVIDDWCFDDSCSGNDISQTLLHIAGSERFRSNVGLVEVLGLDAQVVLEMYDETGALVASREVTLPSSSHRQINDVFDFLGAPDLDNASVIVRPVNLTPIMSYASVIDNQSSDSIFVPGQGAALLDDASLNEWVVPVAASSSGVSGSQWRTDLRVRSVCSADEVDIKFLPDDGSPPVTGSFIIAPSGGLLALDDVVGTLGALGAGALTITSNMPGFDGRIEVTSRTYNTTEEGTYGQLIPAYSVYWPVYHLTALGVESSEHFRTNVGITKAFGDSSVDVLVSLISSTGAVLGSDTWHLEPQQHLQINDIFAALKVPPESNCRVEFEALGFSWGGILAYASVIDNRSGDAIYVPAVQLPESLRKRSAGRVDASATEYPANCGGVHLLRPLCAR
jgi:hypothetical protein